MTPRASTVAVALVAATLTACGGAEEWSAQEIEAQATKHLAATQLPVGSEEVDFTVRCPRGLARAEDSVMCNVSGLDPVLGVEVTEDSDGRLDFKVSVHA